MIDDLNAGRNRTGPWPLCECGERIDHHATAEEAEKGKPPGCWFCPCEEARP